MSARTSARMLHKRLNKALLKALHEALLEALHEETCSAIEDVADTHSEPPLPLHPTTSSISSIWHLIR